MTVAVPHIDSSFPSVGEYLLSSDYLSLCIKIGEWQCKVLKRRRKIEAKLDAVYTEEEFINELNDFFSFYNWFDLESWDSKFKHDISRFKNEEVIIKSTKDVEKVLETTQLPKEIKQEKYYGIYGHSTANLRSNQAAKLMEIIMCFLGDMHDLYNIFERTEFSDGEKQKIIEEIGDINSFLISGIFGGAYNLDFTTESFKEDFLSQALKLEKSLKDFWIKKQGSTLPPLYPHTSS